MPNAINGEKELGLTPSGQLDGLGRASERLSQWNETFHSVWQYVLHIAMAGYKCKCHGVESGKVSTVHSNSKHLK